jgi:predicted neutral ceramidase superfamily lipid hydrolase
MEWTAIQGLIDPQLLIVVAACWVIGYILKTTPHVPDWTIVYAVAAVGIVAANSLLGWSTQSILQGVLCGAVAVYGNQVVKQTVNK